MMEHHGVNQQKKKKEQNNYCFIMLLLCLVTSIHPLPFVISIDHFTKSALMCSDFDE